MDIGNGTSDQETPQCIQTLPFIDQPLLNLGLHEFSEPSTLHTKSNIFTKTKSIRTPKKASIAFTISWWGVHDFDRLMGKKISMLSGEQTLLTLMLNVRKI